MKRILSLIVFITLSLINIASAMNFDKESATGSSAAGEPSASDTTDGKGGVVSDSEGKELGDSFSEMSNEMGPKKIHALSTANDLMRAMVREAEVFGKEVLTFKTNAAVGKAYERPKLNLQFKKRKNGSYKYEARIESSSVLGDSNFEGTLKNGEQEFQIENKVGVTKGTIYWSTSQGPDGPTFKSANYSYTHVFPTGITYTEQRHVEGTKIKWIFKDGTIKTGIVKHDGTFIFTLKWKVGGIWSCIRDAHGHESCEVKFSDGRIKTVVSDGSMTRMEEVLPDGTIDRMELDQRTKGKTKVKQSLLSGPEGEKLEAVKRIHTDCEKCGNVSEDKGFKLCSGCNLVRYCSKACQTEHWKAHKSFCKAKRAEAVERNRTAGSTSQ